MPQISAALDFLLGLTCLALARASARSGNDFLFTGFMWVALAALLGALRLGELADVAPTHDWLSTVSRGPGTLATGLGVLASLWGPWPWSRWAAPALAIAGAALVHLFYQSPHLGLVMSAMGATLLVALVILARRAFAQRQQGRASLALAALALLLLIGFGLSWVSPPEGWLIRRVDVLHILLIAAYSLIWASVRPGNSPT